jgi:hypothetical protein
MSMNAKGVQYTPGEAYGREFRPFGRCQKRPDQSPLFVGPEKEATGRSARAPLAERCHGDLS